MDEKYKFDFLEFHLAQVIGKDGEAKSFNCENTKVYIPKKLDQKMKEVGLKCPNETIQAVYFKKRRLADESESDEEGEVVR